jgi:hypothetical protein
MMQVEFLLCITFVSWEKCINRTLRLICVCTSLFNLPVYATFRLSVTESVAVYLTNLKLDALCCYLRTWEI